ncbi:hypothetical protein DFA_04162 [Cavenderia fasciculata]|uniref:Ankyrin repeat-containing protein n=1 Tax=Cavenderia fasciculata TaxID=261658 RepID=F4Q1G5_CACFS|nr:uncharacterized protein DFA_04162 [Cavenderia fasciculata]EGG18666.1 hypothetical protein DFA_04162 [Cavenderia fasciculata]|eukprot:XP_004366570.1 hypothetical protein DFA_04162 [Cavenderia fasciculata]
MKESFVRFSTLLLNDDRSNIYNQIQCIFNHIKEIGKKIFPKYLTLSGKDIIKQHHLEMISRFTMPWNFIKYYLANKNNVLLKRRMYVISKYCSHQNATLDTLLKLLEWSPEYDPQDQAIIIDDVSARGHFSTIQLLCQLKQHGQVECTTNAIDKAAENGHLNIVRLFFNHRDEGFLDKNIPECKGGTTNAMDRAAEDGCLDIIKFLHENHTQGCSRRAIHIAALFGHFEIEKESIKFRESSHA